MKFYIELKGFHYRYKITDNKLTAIYSNKSNYVQFYKNGMFHNSKNADYVSILRYKYFSLNGLCYGDQHNFTKQSWRKFVKLQAFL